MLFEGNEGERVSSFTQKYVMVEQVGDKLVLATTVVICSGHTMDCPITEYGLEVYLNGIRVSVKRKLTPPFRFDGISRLIFQGTDGGEDVARIGLDRVVTCISD